MYLTIDYARKLAEKLARGEEIPDIKEIMLGIDYQLKMQNRIASRVQKELLETKEYLNELHRIKSLFEMHKKLSKRATGRKCYAK